MPAHRMNTCMTIPLNYEPNTFWAYGAELVMCAPQCDVPFRGWRMRRRALPGGKPHINPDPNRKQANIYRDYSVWLTI
jgi:hypothetical protein